MNKKAKVAAATPELPKAEVKKGIHDAAGNFIAPSGTMPEVTKGAVAVVDEAKLGLKVEQSKFINDIADKIIVGTAQVSKLYYDLCVYIRKNKIAPTAVSHLLGARGFHKVRISEINRVSNAADDVWSDFEAMGIGFRKTLELTRGSVLELAAPELGMEKNELAEAQEEHAQHEGETAGGGGSGDGKEDDSRKFERLAAAMLKLAEKLKFRKIVRVNIGNGYVLEVSKDKKAGKVSVEKADK